MSSIWEYYQEKNAKISTKIRSKEYFVEKDKLIKDFKEALENSHGLLNHPKKDKLFELAWEDSHAYGFYEVEIAYDKLAELLK